MFTVTTMLDENIVLNTESFFIIQKDIPQNKDGKIDYSKDFIG